MGRIQVVYNKYSPTTVPAGISHTRSQLYPRVKIVPVPVPVGYRVGIGYSRVYIYIYLKTIPKNFKNIIITNKNSRKLMRTGNTSNKSS
jgi:hypothetical protein